MEFLELNNGVKMPILGFGTYQITEPNKCEECIINALEAGYRLIDTAQAYGNEEAIGNAIKHSGVSREELFITTKLWFREYETENAEKAIAMSMQKLKLDYIDMVLLHWPFGNIYSAWRVLEKFYKQGKIKAIGISNFDIDRMIDFINFNEIKPALNQIETHLFCQRKNEHKWLEKYGVIHQGYAPLGQGKANDMFENDDIKKIAEKYNKTPAQTALRFLIQSGISVIPKSTHIERIKENIDIFDFELTSDEMKVLQQIDTGKPMIGQAENPETVEYAMTW